jgi:hypothetical protein
MVIILSIFQVFFLISLKDKPTYVQQGKTQSVSHHYLIRAIIERELTRRRCRTWEDFVKLKIEDPNRGGPKGKGIGTREKTILGVRKVVYKTAQEASASELVSKTVKRKIPPTETSTPQKGRSQIVVEEESPEEVTPASKKPTPNLDKGKSINKGKKPVSTPRRVTRLSGVNLETKPSTPSIDAEVPPVPSPKPAIHTPQHESDNEEIPINPNSPISIDSDTESSEQIMSGFNQPEEESDNLSLEEYPSVA